MEGQPPVLLDMTDPNCPNPDRANLTVVILTFNEQDNIGSCIQSLSWADDVVVVDSHSSDETMGCARRTRKDVRLYSNSFEDFGQQRNWALENTAPKHNWVLFLDADERSNECFEGSIRSAIGSPGETVGFFLCYRNMFLGKWIRRCTLYPSWQLRLLKLGHVHYKKEGHGQREVSDGPYEYIKAPYDHYGFSKGVAHWIERHNRYSSDEIELIQKLRNERLALRDLFKGPISRRRCLKRIAARMGCRPFLRFLYLFVIRRGFLDGRSGFMFCRLRVAHEIHIAVKIAEARANQESAQAATEESEQSMKQQVFPTHAP